MKKNSSLSKMILFSVASMFVIASDVIAHSGSVLLWGESKCPKNLLK
ncbi:AgrD family cyclic lactone autoinducer peptide [Alkaliphilus metalliredigens]|nr:cyclic lactone autoinducer peptide [Alkaliphilus metalliredigens]